MSREEFTTAISSLHNRLLDFRAGLECFRRKRGCSPSPLHGALSYLIRECVNVTYTFSFVVFYLILYFPHHHFAFFLFFYVFFVELNSSRKAHRGVFIDFGSAKQRQVSSQMANKQK